MIVCCVYWCLKDKQFKTLCAFVRVRTRTPATLLCRRCQALFPEDGRPYVSLGKLMVQQQRYDEALALYEEGCTATGGWAGGRVWRASVAGGGGGHGTQH